MINNIKSLLNQNILVNKQKFQLIFSVETIDPKKQYVITNKYLKKYTKKVIVLCYV